MKKELKYEIEIVGGEVETAARISLTEEEAAAIAKVARLCNFRYPECELIIRNVTDGKYEQLM